MFVCTIAPCLAKLNWPEHKAVPLSAPNFMPFVFRAIAWMKPYWMTMSSDVAVTMENGWRFSAAWDASQTLTCATTWRVSWNA